MYREPVHPSIGVNYTVGETASGKPGILLAAGADGTPTHPVLLEVGCTLHVLNIPADAQEHLCLTPDPIGQLQNVGSDWTVNFDGVMVPLANFYGLEGVVVRLLATGTI